MSAPVFGDTREKRIVALLGLVLVALAMRNAVVVFGPLFTSISDDLGLDIVVLSFIGGITPIGFALAGLVIPALTHRWGLERTLIGALAAVIFGQGLRALSAEAVVLVGSTMVVMVGIGALNVLLPPVVRRYFPHRIGGMTSLYLVLMGLGASVPALVAVQIADAIGWRFAIGLWLVVPVLALAPWLVMARARRAAAPAVVAPPVVDEAAGTPARVPEVPPRRVATSPTAWAITATLALCSISTYAAIAYLPAMLTSVGVAAGAAGVALGITMAVGIPEALIVPLLATRSRNVLPMIVVSGLCGLAGWGGMLLAPASAPFLWATLIGLLPISFPLSLVLVNTRTRSHRVTVSVSGFVQGVGYVSAGLFALVVGLLHDATGGWQVSVILLLASMGLVVPAVLVLRRNRFVDDEIVTPAGAEAGATR